MILNNDAYATKRVTTALLLAAGMGSRLYPLTNNAPKCLTLVDGVPIIERLVCCLRQQGFKRLVVVVGYLEHCIREFLGPRAGGMTIEYISSPRYATTNNIYSLWLAREIIQEPFLLVESDLVFEAPLLDNMLYPDKIAIASLQPRMKGTTVTIDSFRQVTAFRGGGRETPDQINYKTVNIYSLSLPSWRRVAQRLNQHISAGKVNTFYETVFAEMVADGDLSFQTVFFDVGRWYEIDTIEDLQETERMFSENCEKKPKLRELGQPVLQALRQISQGLTGPDTSARTV